MAIAGRFIKFKVASDSNDASASTFAVDVAGFTTLKK
jgi:hypothetical protein